ncbi:MAG: purine-nucleoside phosphorylase [Eubacterium sp.]|nr:purine-nucleoside phosphorylase [Eubacterium sp.]
MLPKDKLKEVVDYHIQQIRRTTDFVPDLALVLGSGLGGLADEIKTEAVVNYSDLHRFPVSTVPGHKGRFVFGYIGDVRVVIMQGRLHYYEGYSMQDVVMPIRVMAGLGAKILFITNAAGGINTGFEPGDLMMITDQITSFVPSPLIGENVDEWGTRFPSMNVIYDKRLRRLIEETAMDNRIFLKHGIYLQTTGPQYETPAEIRMFRRLGADAVGMSSAVEAVIARHMSMWVCGVSCITNMAGGLGGSAMTHEEVQNNAVKAANEFKKLVTESIIRFGNVIL